MIISVDIVHYTLRDLFRLRKLHVSLTWQRIDPLYLHLLVSH